MDMQLRFLCKIWFNNNLEMARISAILFRATATAPFFYFRDTATCATFLVRASGVVWSRGGAKSGRSAQHCNLPPYLLQHYYTSE